MPTDSKTKSEPPVRCDDLLAPCPWCKDKDFDEVGLKLHVINGHCDAFNALDVSLPVTRQAYEKLTS
jgi:hypothetical protein